MATCACIPVSRLLLPIVPLLLLAVPAAAVTWFVDPSGAGDAHTIKDGLALAASGDTVEVACGTYHERILNLPDGVHLRSATGQPDCVTIDADDRLRVFYCPAVQGGSIVGFTITGGTETRGGGLFCTSLSTFRVADCIFTGNSAAFGAGIYAHHSPITVENCTFSGNSASIAGGAVTADDYSEPVLRNCTFVGNTAGQYGGAVFACFRSHPEIDNSTFAGNEAGVGGGAVLGIGGGFTLTHCSLTGNAAEDGGAVGGWGVMSILTGCTLAGNRASLRGGAIFGDIRSTYSVSNTILWGNCAADGRDLHLVDAGSSVIFGCCDVDSTAGSLEGAGMAFWGADNRFVDPQFCSPEPCQTAPNESGTYWLAADSPCLPENSGGCGRIGAFGDGGCRARGAVPSLSWGRVKTMFRDGGVR